MKNDSTLRDTSIDLGGKMIVFMFFFFLQLIVTHDLKQ